MIVIIVEAGVGLVLFVCNNEWGLARPQTGKSTSKSQELFFGVGRMRMMLFLTQRGDRRSPIPTDPSLKRFQLVVHPRIPNSLG